MKFVEGRMLLEGPAPQESSNADDSDVLKTNRKGSDNHSCSTSKYQSCCWDLVDKCKFGAKLASYTSQGRTILVLNLSLLVSRQAILFLVLTLSLLAFVDKCIFGAKLTPGVYYSQVAVTFVRQMQERHQNECMFEI